MIRPATTESGPVLRQTARRCKSPNRTQHSHKKWTIRGGPGNSNSLRARQRLALPQTPEVRVTLEVPSGAFSPPKLVDPLYDMPGGGLERMGTGEIACRVVAVLDYC